MINYSNLQNYGCKIYKFASFFSFFFFLHFYDYLQEYCTICKSKLLTTTRYVYWVILSRLSAIQLFKQISFPESDNQSVECDKMRLIKSAPRNFAIFNLSWKFNSDEFEQKYDDSASAVFTLLTEVLWLTTNTYNQIISQKWFQNYLIIPYLSYLPRFPDSTLHWKTSSIKWCSCYVIKEPWIPPLL